jgi:sugar lactone lactonase YvrE
VVREGRVYVCDRGNHRVQVFSPGGELLDRFGLHAIRPREGAGFLHYPSALALSPKAELAALGEPMVDRVQVFSRTGGSAEDEVRRQAQSLAKPSAHFGMELETAGPYLALNEPESHSVLFFENTAEEPRRITRVSGLGRKTGLLTGVAGLHFERAARDLWVCDPLMRRLSLFRLRGGEEDEVGFDALMARFVKSLDLARFFELELAGRLEAVPEVVALDRDDEGRLYLCDRRNGCVLVLSKTLGLLEVFGYGRLEEPSGIAVSKDGSRCYVADPATGVQRFAGERREATLLAAASPGGPLARPHDLALAPDGTLFVTDSALHRVFVFDALGELQRSWGGEGLGRGELYKPRGIALDAHGRLSVLDHANHRIQTFTQAGEYVGIFGPRLYTYAARYPDLVREQE